MKLKQLIFIITFYSIAMGFKYIAVSNPNIFINTQNYYITLFLGVGPLLGAIILVHIFKRPNYISLLTPKLLKPLGLVILTVLLFTAFDYLNTGKLSFYVPSFVFIAIVYGAMEEYGWRGYLQSELKPINKLLKYFIVAIMWFLWHLEFSYSLGGFLVLLGGSIGMGYVADQSKSLIYVALFHAFVNLMLTSDLPMLTSTQKISSVTIVAASIILFMVIDKKIAKTEQATI